MTYQEWRDFIDRHILQLMAEYAMSEPLDASGNPILFFPMRYFTNDWITHGMASAVLKDLTRQGFARYRKGLLTEEGNLTGAGYGITQKGMKRYEELCPTVAISSGVA